MQINWTPAKFKRPVVYSLQKMWQRSGAGSPPPPPPPQYIVWRDTDNGSIRLLQVN